MYADVNKRMEYNREYIKGVREWRKHHHYCVDCGKQDAFTLNGRTRCFECQEKANERNRDLTSEQKQKVATRHKNMREYRRKNRLCTSCGRQLPFGNYKHITCQRCRAKGAIDAERRRRESGIPPREYNSVFGLCYKCGRPVDASKTNALGNVRKLCEKCYSDAVAAAEKGRAAYKEKHGTAFGRMNSIRF